MFTRTSSCAFFPVDIVFSTIRMVLHTICSSCVSLVTVPASITLFGCCFSVFLFVSMCVLFYRFPDRRFFRPLDLSDTFNSFLFKQTSGTVWLMEAAGCYTLSIILLFIFSTLFPWINVQACTWISPKPIRQCTKFHYIQWH